MRDLLRNVVLKQVISPVTIGTSDVAHAGTILDHQGYDSVTYGILTGTLGDTNATWTVLLEEFSSSTGGGAASVADGDMISQTEGTAAETAAAFTFASDDQVRILGYKGTSRWTRLTVTSSGSTAAGALAAFALFGHPAQAGTTQGTA
jgi:hypothetical protein